MLWRTAVAMAINLPTGYFLSITRTQAVLKQKQVQPGSKVHLINEVFCLFLFARSFTFKD